MIGRPTEVDCHAQLRPIMKSAWAASWMILHERTFGNGVAQLLVLFLHPVEEMKNQTHRVKTPRDFKSQNQGVEHPDHPEVDQGDRPSAQILVERFSEAIALAV